MAQCPEWEYENFPGYRPILQANVAGLLIALKQGLIDSAGTAQDTRSVHRRMFAALTPPGYDHYAGHYRGEPLPCLQTYNVKIEGDPTVGYPAGSVWAAMSIFAGMVQAGIAGLDQAREVPEATLSKQDKLTNIVAFACRAFELFCRIHPHANGNGHAARFLIWSILIRYGHIPRRWTVEPRPPDPAYTECLKLHRAGNKAPLEKLVLSSLL